MAHEFHAFSEAVSIKRIIIKFHSCTLLCLFFFPTKTVLTALNYHLTGQSFVG